MGLGPRQRWLMFIAPCLLVCFLLLGSCSTAIDLGPAESFYSSANYAGALQSLERRSGELLRAQGPIILNYDLGMLSRLTGDWKRSNELLSESERLITEARTQSVTASLASFIINDNTKPYGGTDYEDLYINVFKALNYLSLGDEEAALVELRRSLEKQSALRQRWAHNEKQIASWARQNNLPYDGSQLYAASFSTSALANWLAAIVADHLDDRSMADHSVAQIPHAFSSQPLLYPFPIPQAAQIQQGQSIKENVHLVSLVGRSPTKEERWDYIYVDKNTRIRVAYPVLVERGSAVASITVHVDGKQIMLQPLESLSKIAVDTFGPTSQVALQKSTLRSMARMLGIAVSDSLSSSDDSNTSFLGDLLGVIFKVSAEVAERADVRTTHFLPAEAWVASLDLKPGTYSAHVVFRSRTGQVLSQQSINPIVVNADSLCFVELPFPR
jgi:hypothetical protein